MGHSSFQQPNFLGGEWSPFFQGRTDHPKYRTAMNVCRNGYPIEEGTWVRRSGTRLCAPTFKGQEAKVYPFYFTDLSPYTVEFTDSNIRFFNSNWPVITEEAYPLSSLSTDDPAILTLIAPVAWHTGDEITFFFGTTTPGSVGQKLRQRTFLITAIPETYSAWDSGTTYNSGDIVTYSGVTYLSIQTGNLDKEPDTNAAWWTALAAGVTRTFSLQDAITGENFDGSTTTLAGAPAGGIYILRILRVATPYANGTWVNARIVQNEDTAVVLNGVNKPQFLTITPNAGTAQAASSTCTDLTFSDGPYLDPVNNSVATMGAASGVTTMSVDFVTYDSTVTYAAGDHVKYGTSAYKSLIGGNLNNQPDTHSADWQPEDRGVAVTGPGSVITGFQDTDVGRLVRLFSEPATWVSGGYTAGDKVKWNDVYYVAVNNNSAEQPDLFPQDWTVDPTGANWTWAQITALTNSNSCTVQIMGDPLGNGSGLPVNLWRLGVYSDTTGYPTCGIFTEGRLWLGGAVANRFDASYVDGVNKDGICNMQPTLADGTVTDANSISYRLEAREHNPITWFAVDHLGIIAGTAGGEWLISASALNDPLTPTSIQARQVTQYKCADIEPRRTGLSLVFVQRFKRRIMELLSDVFTGRFVAPHLTEAAKHLTAGDIEDIGYQEELAPILWMRKGDGSLAGATYRRVSSFTTEAPAFAGFHRHDLGTGRVIESMAVGPSVDGGLDSLMVVTNDTTTNVRWVEMLMQMFDEDDVLENAWFLDGGIVPDTCYADTISMVDGARFTGLWYLQGQTLSVFVGGLDVGDYTVDANGTVFVPFGSGVAPASFNYQAAGAGQYLFTETEFTNLLASSFSPRNGGVGAGLSSITTTTVATNPNSASQILQYVYGSGTPTDNNCVVDWVNGYIVLPDSTNHTLHVMDINAGSEDVAATVSTITSAASTDWAGQTGAIDTHSNIYFGGTTSGSSTPLFSATEAALSLTYTAGINLPLQTVGSMTVISANADWIVGVGSGNFGGGSVGVWRASDGVWVAGLNSSNPVYEGLAGKPWSFLCDQFGVPLVGRGAPTHGGNVASSYIVAQASGVISIYFVGIADGVPAGNDPLLNPGGISKAHGILGLIGKKVANPASISFTPSIDTPISDFATIGTFTASTIGSSTGKVTAMWVDQSDNSVIIVFRGGTTSTVAKFTTGLYSKNNSGTFGLAWVITIQGDIGSGNTIVTPTNSNIKGGLLGIFSPTSDSGKAALYLIDTTTGKYSVVDVPGIVTSVEARQVWDDQTQSIIFFGSYDASVMGAPTGIGGTTTGSSQWYRLYVGTDLVLSPNISSTANVIPTGYTFVDTTTNTVGMPAIVGATYASEGQILRAVAPDQAGSRLGPAFGTTRRTHKMTALVKNAIGMEFGTNFIANIEPWNFKNADGTFCDPQTMFSGMDRREARADADFDNMLCWRIVRPYPASVVAIGAKQESEDV